MDLLTTNDQPGQYPPSFYARSIDLPATLPCAQGALTCDVCIVGGGFSGLSSALHLSQRGYKVIVLEAQCIGFGASGRNGGQVGTGMRLGQDELEQRLGKEAARQLWEISLDAVQRVKNLCADPHINTPFHPGIIYADHRARYVKKSHAYAEKLRDEYGYEDIQALSQDDIRSWVASEAYYGGLLDKGSGHINPLALALGLARMAQAAGAQLFEQSLVTSLDETQPAQVKTAQASIKADYVILACNGYLGKLNGQVNQYVMPINNYMIATAPFSPEKQEALLKHHYAVADSKYVVNYFRFSEDHRLLFGGTESYGYRFPKNIARAVRKPLSEIYPQLRDVRIDYAWGGTLAITMNRMPHFARLQGNIISISGYSGHGVALATLAGQIVAEALAGQAERFDQLARVSMSKFPGGATLRPSLLALAMLWYSLLDNI